MSPDNPSAPLVSILIPCWGCRKYIGETIQSALAQDYAPVEVIVVEDHGDDGTYEAALQFTDARLRVVRNAQNWGQFGNKNRALELAKGEYVKYLDGDDLLEPFAVRVLVEAALRRPSAGVVFGQSISINAAGDRIAGVPRPWGRSGLVRGSELLDHVTRMGLSGSSFGNVTPHLFRRSALLEVGAFPDDNAGPGDLDTFLRLLALTDVVFIDDVVARYRCHPEQMTGRTFGLREATDFVRMVDRLEEFFSRRAGLPPRLYDREFYQEWRVWASDHVTFACFQRRLRNKSREFDRIRAMYREKGLGPRFDRHLAFGFPGFVARTLKQKARVALGRSPMDPLFP